MYVTTGLAVAVAMLVFGCESPVDSTPGEVADALVNPVDDIAASEPRDANLARDAAAEPETEATTCPSPPYGTAVGDTLGDYRLYDCDGKPVSLAATCDRSVTFVNLFAGWCPPCNAHARAAAADHASFTDAVADGAWLFVITEDNDGLAPDLAYCAAVRDAFALPMTVLVDLAGGFPDHLGVGSPNSWYVVLSEGQRIEAKVKYDKDAALTIARGLAD